MKLPDGYRSENTLYGKDIEVFFRPEERGGGMVTIDYKKRIFGGGISIPTELNKTSSVNYSGAGWKERLVNDAITWLEEVMG